MDQMVLETQQWLNATYGNHPGFNKVTEDGITAWPTMYALTRALQIEEGITTLSDNFGSLTTSLFQPMSRVPDDSAPTNRGFILQGALWCKGYNPVGFTGIFAAHTEEAVMTFQLDAGLAADGIVTAKIMKALLNMNGFVLNLLKGDPYVRQIQQDLNYKYNNYFDLIPCDGVYARDTNKALIYAIQAEEGMSTSVANGYFGNGTTSNYPRIAPNLGNTGNVVKIAKYGLYVNGFGDSNFDGVYDSTMEADSKAFQEFVCLPYVYGTINTVEIKALLTSCGDITRSAKACDCATIITSGYAQTLLSSGYQVVGRYLTGTIIVNGVRVSKALTTNELSIILNSGLRVFPIFETGGYEASYFTAARGVADAYSAASTAAALGFEPGTIIYFAVDYDAYDYEVTDNILPYFKAINDTFAKFRSDGSMPSYLIGVYGPRNICIRVAGEGYSVSSFVADMSTGYSGNLGFPLPKDWAFDQFTSTTVTGTSGSIAIDKDAYSGKDIGVSYVNPPILSSPSDAEIKAARLQMLTDITKYIPVLNGIPSVEFEFDTTYTIMDDVTMKVELTTSTTTTINPGSGSTISINVTDGKPDPSYIQQLDDYSVTAGLSDVKTYEDLVDKLSMSISIGVIDIEVSHPEGALEVSVSTTAPEIQVTDNFTTSLSVKVTFTLKDYSPNDFSTALKDVATSPYLIPVLIVAGAAAILLLPETGLASLCSFLGGLLLA